MSYIQFQQRCSDCKKTWNAAFGIVGITQIAAPPKVCPYCKSENIEKSAEKWRNGSLMKNENSTHYVSDQIAAEDWFAITSTGDGAETIVVPESQLKSTMHEVYCCCGKTWDNCELPDVKQSVMSTDDDDAWTKEYPDYKRHIWQDHGEDYTVTIARLTKLPAWATRETRGTPAPGKLQNSEFHVYEQALRLIAERDISCECSHDTEDCCAKVNVFCAHCIAETALHAPNVAHPVKEKLAHYRELAKTSEHVSHGDPEEMRQEDAAVFEAFGPSREKANAVSQPVAPQPRKLIMSHAEAVEEDRQFHKTVEPVARGLGEAGKHLRSITREVPIDPEFAIDPDTDPDESGAAPAGTQPAQERK